MPTLPGMQFVQNQVIGSVIAAVLKTVKYKRATKPPKAQQFNPATYWYGNIFPVHTITQEAYEFMADTTEHPVETGCIFSDHVILKPIRLNVTFEISNYDGLGKDAEKAKYALSCFHDAWKSRQPMALLTTHMLLDNMVLIGFQPENNAPEWGKLTIRATFKQVSLAALESVRFTPNQVQGDSTGNSTKQLGPKTPLTAVKSKDMGKKTVSGATSKASSFKQGLEKFWGMIK